MIIVLDKYKELYSRAVPKGLKTLLGRANLEGPVHQNTIKAQS